MLTMTFLSLTLSFATVIIFHKFAHFMGLVKQGNSHGHHLHEKCTPLVGGIGIFIATLITTSIATVFSNVQLYPFVMVGAFLLFIVGIVDDRQHISPGVRLLIQITAASLLVSGNESKIIELGTFFWSDTPVLLDNWSIPFTIFAIVGLINAFNMVDGINGLAGFLATISLASIAYSSNTHYIVAYSSILIGAIAGYLIFNLGFAGDRNIIFLGDSGSTILGYLLAWLLIETANDPTSSLSPIGILLLIAIPVVDAVNVMIRRALLKRSPFKADKRHLHHLVLLTGKTHLFTLISITSFSAILALLAVFQTNLQISDTFLLIVFCGLFFILHILIKKAYEGNINKHTVLKFKKNIRN